MAIPAFRVTPTDGVVRLREWRPADVADMAAACRDPEIARWTMVPDDYRESDARAFVAGRDAARRAGEALDAAVVDAGDGALLGAVALTSVDWRHERAEIGYWVAPGRAGAASPPARCACCRRGPSRTPRSGGST